MSKDIFVVVEQRGGQVQKVALELICEAKKLAGVLGQRVAAILIGEKVADKAQVLFEHGADKVVVVEDPMLKQYATEPYTKALTVVIREQDPEIVLFGATSIGRDLAPRVAARIHTGLTADCTGLAIDPDEKLLLMTRPAFSGNLMATIVCKNYRPQMATVRPGVMKLEEPQKGRTGELINMHVPFSASDMNVEILEIQPHTKKTLDIAEAKILVSAGRGIGGTGGLPAIDALADALGGDVSASRACVDAGWTGKERQVGQTGKTVRPGLYFACGISGAAQHLVGMEDSEFILAINKDESAPIMDMADLAIVGDVGEILPKLTDAIVKFKQNKAEC